jgi:uncharacterized membrane protein
MRTVVHEREGAVEVIGVLVGLGFLGLFVLALVGGLVAWLRSSRLEGRLRDLEADVRALDGQVHALRRAAVQSPPADAAQAPVTPTSAEAASARVPVAAAPPEAGPMLPPPRPGVAARRLAPPVPPRPAAPPSPPRPPSPPQDFATNLGPKLLVGTGALAFVVFLGLFVKYAWDNDWVGPTGRVLMGAVIGLGLLATGLRLLGREYRPLGQGLAAAGLVGLYTSAYGAHGFYDLIPRWAAGGLMLGITASAVLLAGRLNTRLLAALAWVGAYLVPLLLSTGEDKALSLFLYLALLAAGALVLDHWRPWPETVPLAMAGTLVLYTGWYARFFRPERFETAAFGVVLFTALFALGMARKERAEGLAAVFCMAAMGLTVMAGGTDRPGPLLVLSLGLAAAALWTARRFGWGLSAVAALAVALPFATWSIAHYQADDFGVAAAWIVGALLLFAVPLAGEAVPVALEGLVLAGGGLASALLCLQSDRPVSILGLLLAQAGVAVIARQRWSGAYVVGVASAAVSVLAWWSRYFEPSRAADAYMLSVPVAGVYLLAFLVRGLRGAMRLELPDAVAHPLNAFFLWTVLYNTLSATRPDLLGVVATALAAVYLAVGLLFLRRRRDDPAQARVLLGLAAMFVTLAIPVQLGLHGITLGWAVEGVVLLALGLRFATPWARAGGYVVLGLAVLRLLARHLPLHPGGFTPVFNPAFGTWLLVIGALGAALLVTREARRQKLAPDQQLWPILACLALVLLFGLLTAETADAFRQRATLAQAGGDLAAAEGARRGGGLAVSVLWTVFATALLSAGLFARSHALFYSAYGLFALTAAKVVMWDLAQFSLPYRMLSFLALALLLLAGAFLNLRFRERLAPPPHAT